MNKYARIGRSCLVHAIGLQRNHTITVIKETEEIDRERHCCYHCPHFTKMHMESYAMMPEQMKCKMDNLCMECPNCAYKKESVTRYVNEKNRYGYGERLGLIPTKFLIYCHFLGPDKNGLVKYVSIADASKVIGCSRKSILNAVEKLTGYQYAMVGKCGRGLLNVILLSYKDLALPADQGGRGYITVNKDMCQRIMGCRNVIQLRIMLRVLLDSDTSKDGTASTDMGTLRRFLPSYCKPGIIKKTLARTGFLFSIKDNGNIKIKLDAVSCGRLRFLDDFKQYLASLKAHIFKIDSDMENANRKTAAHKSCTPEQRRLRKSGYTLDVNSNGMKFYVPFQLSEQDFKDLANVAITFSIEEVKNALVVVYNNYNVSFKKYQIGPLVRSLLKYGEVPFFQ